MRLYCDNSGEIWIGTWGGGLNRLVLDQKLLTSSATKGIKDAILFVSYCHNENDRTSISGNSIYSIFEE